MVSELWLSKGIMKISSTIKKVIKRIARHLKKSIKEVWSLIFSSNKESIIEKDEGLFSTLSTKFQDEDIWVIDSDASRHMAGHSHQLKTLSRGKIAYFVELGDKKSYDVKSIGSSSIKLEDGRNIHLNNIMFVPGLHKNLLSISSLEDKGDRVAFIDGRVSFWGKDSSIEKAKVIGIREGRLYRLISPVNHALVHTEIIPCELWHKRFGHLHFKILPTVNSILDVIPNLKEDD